MIKTINIIEIEKPKTERINIKGEWDVNGICNAIIKHTHVMIRAEYQGSSKTFAAQHMVKLGYRVLFVCPTNKLTQYNGETGATLNQFFGMSIINDETLTKIDASSFDAIVFDETYFVDIFKLSKI